MLNPIFWKKVQGQKHPGRWGIVEHQIPSIKVLFKTNTKGHKHPSIRLLSKSQTKLVNQRKQKVAFSPGTAHSPEIQSYRTWWGAASPILNDTPVVYIYIYTSYNRTHIRNAYIYIYINTELLDGNQGHQEEAHHPTHRFRRLFLDLLWMGWRGCASAMGAIKLPPSCSNSIEPKQLDTRKKKQNVTSPTADQLSFSWYSCNYANCGIRSRYTATYGYRIVESSLV